MRITAPRANTKKMGGFQIHILRHMLIAMKARGSPMYPVRALRPEKVQPHPPVFFGNDDVTRGQHFFDILEWGSKRGVVPRLAPAQCWVVTPKTKRLPAVVLPQLEPPKITCIGPLSNGSSCTATRRSQRSSSQSQRGSKSPTSLSSFAGPSQNLKTPTIPVVATRSSQTKINIMRDVVRSGLLVPSSPANLMPQEAGNTSRRGSWLGMGSRRNSRRNSSCVREEVKAPTDIGPKGQLSPIGALHVPGKDLSDPRAYFSTFSEMEEMLQACGVDTTLFGVGRGKKLRELWAEYCNGRCIFSLRSGDSKPIRYIIVVRVRLVADLQGSRRRVLIERFRRSGEDGIKQRIDAFPQRSMSPNESLEAAVTKCLMDTFALDLAWQSQYTAFEEGRVRTWEEELDSDAYPGIHCMQCVSEVDVKIKDPSGLFFVLGMPDLSDFPTTSTDRALGEIKHLWFWEPLSQTMLPSFTSSGKPLSTQKALGYNRCKSPGGLERSRSTSPVKEELEESTSLLKLLDDFTQREANA